MTINDKQRAAIHRAPLLAEKVREGAHALPLIDASVKKLDPNQQPRVNDPPERRERLTTKARRAQRRTKEEKELNDPGGLALSHAFSLFPFLAFLRVSW